MKILETCNCCQVTHEKGSLFPLVLHLDPLDVPTTHEKLGIHLCGECVQLHLDHLLDWQPLWENVTDENDEPVHAEERGTMGSPQTVLNDYEDY